MSQTAAPEQKVQTSSAATEAKQTLSAHTIADNSPAALAQRKRRETLSAHAGQSMSFSDSSPESSVQMMRKSVLAAQPKSAVLPLQGKFASAQLEGVDEEELLQGKFAQITGSAEPIHRKVDPTTTVAGVPVNDDPSLETEADVMGAKAAQFVLDTGTDTLQQAKKANDTGLPDNLKAGVENLSGMSLDGVKVHYNSDKPAQLNAHAYAQGTDIHVAPGQEQHLPHEAWHVVQQGGGEAVQQVSSDMHAQVEKSKENKRQSAANSIQSKIYEKNSHGIMDNRSAKRANLVKRDEFCYQFKKIVFKPKIKNEEGNDDDSKLPTELNGLNEIAKEIDKATLGAAEYIKSVIEKGPVKKVDFPASTNERYTNWIRNFDAKNTGYMIEDIVTARVAGNESITPQFSTEKARPDFHIVDNSNNKEGVVDVTSSKEAGHILDKNFSKSKWSFIAEAIYPSFNIDQGRVSIDPVDDELIEKAAKTRADSKWMELVNKCQESISLYKGGLSVDPESFNSLCRMYKILTSVKKKREKVKQEVITAYDEERLRLPEGVRPDSLNSIEKYIHDHYLLTGHFPWAL